MWPRAKMPPVMDAEQGSIVLDPNVLAGNRYCAPSRCPKPGLIGIRVGWKLPGRWLVNGATNGYGQEPYP
jgi:hypothetical protein